MTPDLRTAIEKRANEIVEAFKQDRTAAGLKRYLADEMFNVACLAQQQEREHLRKKILGIVEKSQWGRAGDDQQRAIL